MKQPGLLLDKMCSSGFENRKLLVGYLILMSLFYFCHTFHISPMPCDVSSTKSCTASLYYIPNTMKSLEEIASLFHVNANAVHRTISGFLIRINCSCPPEQNGFTSHMDYLVQPGDSWEIISSKFGSFVVEKPEKVLITSHNVTLDLLCGCFGSTGVVTYKVERGDTLFTICSRFKADLNKAVWLNRLQNPSLIYFGDIIFIPTPGLQNLTLLNDNDKDATVRKASKSRIPILVGVISAALIVVVLAVLVFWIKCRRKRPRQSKAFSKRVECNLDACTYHTDTKSEERLVSSLNSDKANVLPYCEIRDATSNFSTSLKIGQGSYGSVYLGKIRGTDVAIKQMKNAKSKEFLSELNILCNVHHRNLIELIGYGAGEGSLFLVYEFVQNGALSDHLHKPTTRGYKPLPWTTRVQIALDAAKGLEYIHEHTKPYYVHRDVKTSNILLDSHFRAKIADFGLVKLLEHSSDVRDAASRIVGTFGYLAPEYARDGCITTKSDVYAFGVVLMELLTGKPALSKDSSHEKDDITEHHSLVQYILSALNDKEGSFTQLTKCVDPNLACYHKDSFFHMALLSKDCVDDNWSRRPDMSRVVLHLSHILLDSKKWEEELDCNYLTG